MNARKNSAARTANARVSSPRISSDADHDLDGRQGVADGRARSLGEDLEGADRTDVAGRVGELRQPGHEVDDADDQARDEADPLLHDASSLRNGPEHAG